MEHLNLTPEPARPPAVVRQPETVFAGPYSDAGFEREDESDSAIMEYLRILRRHKGAVMAFTLLGIALSLGMTAIQTPTYRAQTSLEVLNMNQDFMNMKQASPVSEVAATDDTSEVQTQVKILQNDELVNRVLMKLDPGFRPEDADAVARTQVSGWQAWLKILHVAPHGAATPHQKALAGVARSLRVTATPRTRVIVVTVDSSDPQLAADFANTLDSEFIAQNLESRYKTTQNMGDWLEREIGDAREKLARSEDALQAYARSSGLIFTNKDEGSVATEKLQQIQTQLSAASSDRISKQSRFELAQNAPPEALPDVLNDSHYREGQAKLNELRGQIADLSAIYNPGYGKLKELQAQAASLQAALDATRGDILGRIKNEYTEAQRREGLLATAYDEQTREVGGQGEKAVQYNILKREADSNRQLYDLMLQQLKQSAIATAINASNLRIVDAARPPLFPVSPSLPINLGIGTFLGLFVGVAVVLVRERADRTLQEPGEASFWTNLPELGVIPSGSAEPRQTLKAGRGLALDGAKPEDGRARLPVELITSRQAGSFVAEAFRTVLTSILFVGENGTSPRVLVFTSAAPAEGKSTVVSNLAIALSEIGRKVLVIDADLRRPRQHKIFGVPSDAGLSDLLKSLDGEPDAWTGMVQDTVVPGLWLLPSGPATQAAANLLYSPRLGELLAKVRREYDMVLIDSPPMLQMTDARVLGRLAEGVILVTRAQRTTRDALLAATQRFGEDRIRVLGTILNDWNPKHSPNGYYGYYQNSYYYGSDKDKDNDAGGDKGSKADKSGKKVKTAAAAGGRSNLVRNMFMLGIAALIGLAVISGSVEPFHLRESSLSVQPFLGNGTWSLSQHDLAHFGVFALLELLVFIASSNKIVRALGVTGGILLGLGIEWYQFISYPDIAFETRDVVADSAGVLLVALAAMAWSQFQTRDSRTSSSPRRSSSSTLLGEDPAEL